MQLISKLFSRWNQINRKGPDMQWVLLQTKMKEASTVIDLGCGATPHSLANVGVDAYISPLQRSFGFGEKILIDRFIKSKKLFTQANVEDLPFGENSFDFAYSHHVFEHLENPQKGCLEMMRIAKAGAIITPSVFAENIFGRPYHKWLVTSRANTIIFIEKDIYNPFGEHPLKKGDRYIVDKNTNPFDILLNDGMWYFGLEQMPRLSKKLRTYWYAHSPVIENIFIWERSFKCIVIKNDGSIIG